MFILGVSTRVGCFMHSFSQETRQRPMAADVEEDGGGRCKLPFAFCNEDIRAVVVLISENRELVLFHPFKPKNHGKKSMSELSNHGS